MTQTAIRSKWKFVVEFEDPETNEISGTIGQAETLEECEGLIECDMQFHFFNGRTVLNAEAAEICSQCEGDGKILVGNGRLIICDACHGHLGPLSSLRLDPPQSHRPEEADLLQFDILSNRVPSPVFDHSGPFAIRVAQG
jgi:hypothetical protein